MSQELAPIFLVEAEKYLENRDFDRAIELCKRGIEYFPDYYLGYVLLTEALESVGNFEQADSIFETASIHFANNLFFREIARRRSKFGRLLIQEDENSNNISTDSFSNEQFDRSQLNQNEILKYLQLENIDFEHISADDIFLIPGLDFTPFKISDTNPKITDLQIFNDIISDKIPNIQVYCDTEEQEQPNVDQNISIPDIMNDEQDQFEDFSQIIPTETLAEIYVRQKKINEAIGIFEKLISKHPDKSQYYSERIQKIKSNSL